MKLIAVSQRTRYLKYYNEYDDALDQCWHHFFLACGLTPLLLPNQINLAQSLLQLSPLTGIVLTGGDDHPKRITVENYLLEFAIKNRIPLIGVCHGMQMIQRYFGLIMEPCEGHITDQQQIWLDNKLITVNSYHTYGTKNSISKLHVLAKSSDGIIKAIQHSSYPITGIMWHPERLSPYAERDIQLFKRVFQ